MDDWEDIASAPKDGSLIRVKRVYQGRVVYEGPATWRSVHFGALHDPLTGECYAEPYDATGWMHPREDKRVPEPTHWRAGA